MNKQEQRTSPCAECPFARHIKPGALGGSPTSTYVGQANGPFWLPCHCSTDFNDPKWKTDVTKPQCAGAAIFRANVEVADKMPDFLLKLPKDTTKVFASFAEFVAHHEQVPLDTAAQFIKAFPPDLWTRCEMSKISARHFVTPKAP